MKKYYYLIGSSYRTVDGGFGVTSFTVTQDEKYDFTTQKSLDYLSNETKNLISNKNGLDVESAFVISISYLGHMTKEEFDE